jgi:hypothetical protein
LPDRAVWSTIPGVDRRQRIALLVAAWASLLTAAAHTMGHLAGPRPPADPEEATLLHLMTGHRMQIMGTERTLSDFLDGFSWVYTLMHVMLAAAAFLVVRLRRQDGPLILVVARFGAVVAALLVVIAVRYFVAPPIVCDAVVALAFGVASLRARAAPS